LRQFDQPTSGDHPLDILSLARWQTALGMTGEAEDNLRLALAQDLPLAHYQQALLDLALLLKRSGRRDQAVPLWQQSAVTTFDNVSAHVELAKHYEWQTGELEKAREWTGRALALVDSWQPREAQLARPELEHRFQRLLRKIEGRLSS
jgi:tetratricopeptide (TPR) repeat protein